MGGKHSDRPMNPEHLSNDTKMVSPGKHYNINDDNPAPEWVKKYHTYSEDSFLDSDNPKYENYLRIPLKTTFLSNQKKIPEGYSIRIKHEGPGTKSSKASFNCPGGDLVTNCTIESSSNDADIAIRKQTPSLEQSTRVYMIIPYNRNDDLDYVHDPGYSNKGEVNLGKLQIEYRKQGSNTKIEREFDIGYRFTLWDEFNQDVLQNSFSSWSQAKNIDSLP